MRKMNPFVTSAVIFRVAELFVEASWKVPAIVERVNNEFPGVGLNRQSIYLLLAKAKEKGFLRLIPPVEAALERRVREKFGLAEDEVKSVTVVDCPRPESSDAVAATAAEVGCQLIKRIGKAQGGRPVGLGLGPGRATLKFSQSISELIKGDVSLPKLNLFSISAGCTADAPQYASSSFFNLFPPEKVEKRMGLFAQPLVRSRDFQSMKGLPEVKDVFDAKDEIDLIVTSMGNMADEHTLYRVFMNRCYPDAKKRPAWLKECVGDVQYRPFSKEGPIHEQLNEYRLVTLFDLEELVQMAKEKGKYILLIARQCGLCKKQMTRAGALLPMMTNPKLRLFTHLVMDSPTAKELLG